MGALKLIADAAGEQIDIDTARRHCRITPEGSPPAHEDDALLEDVYIPAAREWCEDYAGVLMAQRQYEYVLDEFPAENSIVLPIGPVTSVYEITYLDADGVEQTLAPTDYTFDDVSVPQRVVLNPDVTWPETDAVINAVRIGFYAGYDTPGTSPTGFVLPRRARIAMLLVLTHLYENRGIAVDRALSEVPEGPKCWLDPIRRRRGWA